MSSPMKQKRASPVKEGHAKSTTISSGSPSKRSASDLQETKENEETNPTPSKKQKRLDNANAFITSSPRRDTKATPRKVSRNLTPELELSSKDESTPSTTVVLSEPPAPPKKSLLNVLFSPVFKQYNSLFGTKTESEVDVESELSVDKKKEMTTEIKEIYVQYSDEEEDSETDESDKELEEVEEEEEEDGNDTEEETVAKNLNELSSDEVLSEISNSAVEEVEEHEEEEDDESSDVDTDEFDPYHFIANLPALQSHHLNRPIVLPPKHENDKKITLVLDLDETLVHCSTEPIPFAELTFPVLFNDTEYKVFVRKRPYFHDFLKAVSKKFEVVIFTASQEVYAGKLLNYLDPNQEYIHHRLYRDSCINVEGNLLKDLTILGRDLSKVIIVDNSPQTFGYQLDNGIPIESWFDDNEDKELLELLPFLDKLHQSMDVRPHILEKYNLRHKVSLYKKNR